MSEDSEDNDFGEVDSTEKKMKSPSDLTFTEVISFLDDIAKKIAEIRGNPVLYLFYPISSSICKPQAINLYQSFIERGEVKKS